MLFGFPPVLDLIQELIFRADASDAALPLVMASTPIRHGVRRVLVLQVRDEVLVRGADGVPRRVAGRLPERPDVVDHEIGRPGGPVQAVAAGAPVTEPEQVRGRVDLAGLDGVDVPDREVPVVVRAGTASTNGTSPARAGCSRCTCWSAT